MTITTNASFDAYHALAQKWPLYTIEFDGESTLYCNHKPTSAIETYKRYLVDIRGLEQVVKPEKGQATIGGITITLLDKNDEITALIATDSVNFHRKKVIVRAGYKGMAEADLLIIATFWITGLKKSGNNLSWEFTATDPQKWLQKTIYRNATEASPYYVYGNAINILLEILTSSDAGTNSDYDRGDADYGCGLDGDTVDIDIIERVRNDWFWAADYYLYFTITESIEAKRFIENEILQVLNCYPGITAEGKYRIIPFRPPIRTTYDGLSLNENNIVGIPQIDLNFAGTINEVEIFYDHDGDDYLSDVYYVDATSYNARGNSAKELKIESKGLHTTISGSSSTTRINTVINSRVSSIFQRYANPPLKLPVKTLFGRWISEAGDIVDITHSKVSNVETGTMGINEYVEIVRRAVDWKKGSVNIDLMLTGFNRGTYSAFSPYLPVVSGSSSTAFTTTTVQAALFEEGWEVKIVNANMRIIASNITILTINESTGAITCDDIGQTPSAGWAAIFEDYDGATTDQQKYAFIADSSNYLGAANDPAHLICA